MVRTSTGRTRVNIYLDTAVLFGLRRLAVRQGRPVAEVHREALRTFLLEHAQKLATEQDNLDKAGTP